MGLLQIEVQAVYLKGKTWSMHDIYNKKLKFYSTMNNKLTSSWPVAIPFQ